MLHLFDQKHSTTVVKYYYNLKYNFPVMAKLNFPYIYRVSVPEI